MKIELKTDSEKNFTGWDIIPENEDEQKVLGNIRNAYFFGLEDTQTYPEYDGMECEEKHNNRFVTKLKFVIPKYKKS